MEELIVQNYNHPCIAVWGLSNEITAASAVNEELLENHRALNDLAHKLDPTRPTTMATVSYTHLALLIFLGTITLYHIRNLHNISHRKI